MTASPRPPRPKQEPKPIACTTSDMAKILGISDRSAWTLINTGQVRSFRVGRSIRVLYEAIEEFAQQGGTK
ncbi:helix-turn-helix domain-containing protein [Pirellulaceae bacterium SH449]